MKLKIFNQLDFSTLLFDTLFGLVLFYSFDSLLDIRNTLNFIFYLFSTIIVVHWWLMFKSADDIYAEEVTDSAADLIIGILDVIFLDYVVIISRGTTFANAIYYLFALFILDLIWALIWRFVGAWRTIDKGKIGFMEGRLNKNIYIDIFMILGISGLIVTQNLFSPVLFSIVYIGLYCLYMAFTFLYKVVDIDIF